MTVDIRVRCGSSSDLVPSGMIQDEACKLGRQLDLNGMGEEYILKKNISFIHAHELRRLTRRRRLWKCRQAISLESGTLDNLPDMDISL